GPASLRARRALVSPGPPLWRLGDPRPARGGPRADDVAGPRPDCRDRPIATREEWGRGICRSRTTSRRRRCRRGRRRSPAVAGGALVRPRPPSPTRDRARYEVGGGGSSSQAATDTGTAQTSPSRSRTLRVRITPRSVRARRVRVSRFQPESTYLLSKATFFIQ